MQLEGEEEPDRDRIIEAVCAEANKDRDRIIEAACAGVNNY